MTFARSQCRFVSRGLIGLPGALGGGRGGYERTGELIFAPTPADGKPELAWEEHHAHDVLTAYMEKQEGFVVERKICQLDTAWRASFGSEGPLIGFCSEME